MSETLNLHVRPPFALSSLPYARLFGNEYLAVQYFRCSLARYLYVGCVPQHIVGGTLCNGRPIEQRLLVYMLSEAVDVYPKEKYFVDSVSPARFFWMNVAGDRSLKPADIHGRGDNMESLCITGYNAAGVQKHIAVHRILGWTFLCPPRLLTSRWGGEWDVEHKDDNHGMTCLRGVRACER